jgi:cyclopropane fatty-acyl-phospholipid synthase-like methyltransferase
MDPPMAESSLSAARASGSLRERVVREPAAREGMVREPAARAPSLIPASVIPESASMIPASVISASMSAPSMLPPLAAPGSVPPSSLLPASAVQSILPPSVQMASTPMTPLAIALSDRVVFNDEKLARKYASDPIPISTLYEAYFDGGIDIPGDLVAFLRSRNAFVKHTITRQHLQWAVTNFVPEMVAHSREADARSAREIFDDRGEDFFRAFLGERLAFSCGHFEFPTDTLETAVEQASSRICDKIGLRASHRVLDVGAGWGAFLSHVAASRGAEGVGVTLSRSQEAHANRRFTELGVEHQARTLLADYRDLPAEKFDRVVCIEAVERVGVKNLKAFFEKLTEHVKDDGLLFLQWTGLRRQLRPEDLMWGLFINKYILPGADAALPLSSMLKVAEKAGWEVRGVENVSQHYVQTLRLWRTNWEARRERISAEHGERWFRIWQFFLAWSQLVAEQGSAACFQVVLNKNLDSLDRRGL